MFFFLNFPCAYAVFRFQTTQANASLSEKERNRKILFLVLMLMLRALILAPVLMLVLAWLVKTGFNTCGFFLQQTPDMERILQHPKYNLPISTVEATILLNTACRNLTSKKSLSSIFYVCNFLVTFPNLVGPGIGLIFNSPVPMLLLRPFRTCSGVQSTRGLCTFHQLS